jgi:hypothetical protein
MILVLRSVLLSFLLLSLVCCSEKAIKHNNFGNDIQLSNVSSVPITNEGSNLLILQFNNNLAYDLTDTKFDIIDSSGVVSNSSLDVSACAFVRSGDSCLIRISMPHSYVGSFVLEAKNHEYKSSRVINYGVVDYYNNYSIGRLDNDLDVSYGSKITLVIPFRSHVTLNDSYVSIDGKFDLTNSKIVCDKQNGIVPANQLCSAIIEGVASSTNFSLAIVGNQGQYRSNNFEVTLNNAQIGYLVPSVAKKIFTPNESLVVTFLNMGLKAVSNINFTLPSINDSIVNNSCTGSIESNSTCQITIKSVDKVSGNKIFGYIYNNGVSNVSSIFSAFYQTSTNVPVLNMTVVSGNLSTVVGSSESLLVSVSNIGTTPIDSIVFSSESRQNQSMRYEASSSCFTNFGALPVGSSCNLIVKYTPTVAERNYLGIYAKVNYYDRDNNQLTYTNTQINVQYIANLAILYIGHNDQSNTAPNSRFSSCQITESGSIYNCQYESGSGVINSNKILAFTSFRNNLNQNKAILVVQDSGDYFSCDINSTGRFTNCIQKIDQKSNLTLTVNAKMLLFAGIRYLYVARNSSSDAVKRCQMSESGILSQCENVATGTIQSNFSNFFMFAINNGYMYFPTFDGFGLGFNCAITNDGKFDANGCYRSDVGGEGYDYITSILFTNVNGKSFAYLLSAKSNGGGSSPSAAKNLLRCNYKLGNSDYANSSSTKRTNDGALESCVILNTTFNINEARGMDIFRQNGMQYIYYTDATNRSQLYRVKINNDGSVSLPDTIVIGTNQLPPQPEQLYFSSVYPPTKMQYVTRDWSNGLISVLPGYKISQSIMMLGDVEPNTITYNTNNIKVVAESANFANNTFTSFGINIESTLSGIATLTPTATKGSLDNLSIKLESPVFLVKTSFSNAADTSSCFYDFSSGNFISTCPRLTFPSTVNYRLSYAVFRDLSNNYYLLSSYQGGDKGVERCTLNPKLAGFIINDGLYHNDLLIDKNSCTKAVTFNLSNIGIEVKKFKDNTIYLYVTNSNISSTDNIYRYRIQESNGIIDTTSIIKYVESRINANRGISISNNESYIYIARSFSTTPTPGIAKCNLNNSHDIVTSSCNTIPLYSGNIESGNVINFDNNTKPYDIQFATINNITYSYFAQTDGNNQPNSMAIVKCRVVESNGNFVSCVRWQHSDVSKEWSNRFSGLRMVTLKQSLNGTWRLYFTDIGSTASNIVESFKLDSLGDIESGSYRSINRDSSATMNLVTNNEGIFFLDSIN